MMMFFSLYLDRALQQQVLVEATSTVLIVRGVTK
jgi:hypothetical protein